MIRPIATTLALLASAAQGLACTAVDLVAKDGSVVAGRTMEWAFDMDWTLKGVPKGSKLTLTAPAALGLPANEVTTTHAFVGVSADVIPGGAILEGQNDAGLGMSGNFLPGFTEYETVTKDDTSYVSILGFGAWVLGMNGSVADVRAALPKIRLWSDASLPSGPTPPTIHMIFTDRSGDGLVVEYVGGALQMHDNVAHVLTNAPPYDWHLNNARNYLDLSNQGVAEVWIGDANVTALGQGGGLLGLPADYTPPSRFIRAAALRTMTETPATGADAIQAVGHILNNVDIPIGVARSKAGDEIVSDYTQWVAIKDLTGDRLMIADYAHRTSFVTLDLEPIFAQTKPTSVKISDLPYPEAVDATAALRE
jgi:penicillin V acylase-like amidase (Ntn superfamily)